MHYTDSKQWQTCLSQEPRKNPTPSLISSHRTAEKKNTVLSYPTPPHVHAMYPSTLYSVVMFPYIITYPVTAGSLTFLTPSALATSDLHPGP